MNALLLVLVVVVSILAGQSYGSKVATQATSNGRLTGHLTFFDEATLLRTKRQTGGRGTPRRNDGGRGRNGGGRRPPVDPPAPEVTTPEAIPEVTTPEAIPEVTTPEAIPEVTTPEAIPEVTMSEATPEVTTPAPTVETRDLTTDASESDCESLVYRTADGSCNNLKYPSRGSADQPFIRLMDPEYTVLTVDDEKIYAPKRYSEVNQAELPNVRLISRFIHDPEDHPSQGTVMAMQWGQFLDHDITATPVNPENKTCCSLSLILNDAQHEDVNTNGPCFPIIIPDDDTHFTATEERCMENKRSYQTTVDGIPEQINIISSFVDGSQVYGSSTSQMLSLRSSDKGPGRLADKDDNLPEGLSSSCIITEGREGLDYCLLAGDSRVNVYPGLGALHTVFMRMHNVIADGLAGVHTDWDDETVFQEARRINIALLQKITYSDWLRVIVGTDAMETYHLSSGNYAYDEEENPTLANVFSTAAFRFGHSMIPDGLLINELFYESIVLFNNPHYVIHSLDSLTAGLLTNVSQRVDRWYSTGMTNHMFETSAFNGLDIVSLNVQRGRDHGLPSYNKWRGLCGVTTLTAFADIGGGNRRYSTVYGHVDDIDLYSGALNERPVTGGMVGETYACLIGMQFEALKYGDRFWYENPNSPNPFDTDQIREIERQTLASVLCQTTGIQSAQRNVFRTSNGNNNPSRNCDEYPTIQFDLF